MPKKVVVVAAGWLGDNIMLGSLLRILKEQGHHVTILNTHAHFIGIFSRIQGIDQVIDWPIAKKRLHLLQRLRCATILRTYQFDTIIYAPNTFKSALIGFFAGIRERIGWHGESRYAIINQRHINKNRCHTMVQTYVQLAYPTTHPIIPHAACPHPQIIPHHTSLSTLATACHISLPSSQTRHIMLCPGAAAGETKRWPITHFTVLSQQLLHDGYTVHILGGPQEIPLGAHIQQHTNNRCINWTGKTTLTEVIDVMQHADCVVANDSGLMHMAAALSIPVIAIYGATSPHYAPPLSQDRYVFSVPVPCRPCGKNQCPIKTLDCLHGVSVESIYTAITQRIVKKA